MDFPKVYFHDRQSSPPSDKLGAPPPPNSKNPKTKEIFDCTTLAAILIYHWGPEKVSYDDLSFMEYSLA